MNIQPITPNEWLGLTLEQAVNKAQNMGYTYRIVEENGVAKMVEYSNKSNRVNFRIKNDRIIDVYPG